MGRHIANLALRALEDLFAARSPGHSPNMRLRQAGSSWNRPTQSVLASEGRGVGTAENERPGAQSAGISAPGPVPTPQERSKGRAAVGDRWRIRVGFLRRFFISAA